MAEALGVGEEAVCGVKNERPGGRHYTVTGSLRVAMLGSHRGLRSVGGAFATRQGKRYCPIESHAQDEIQRCTRPRDAGRKPAPPDRLESEEV